MRAALLQMRSGIDPVENTRTIADALGRAAEDGADMLFTPEMAVLLDRDRKRAAPHIVREADSRPLADLRDAAAKAGIWLHIGSIPLAAEEGGKWVNRSFIVAPDGAIAARYDKMHLFDVSLDTGETWRESAVYAGGEAPVVAKTPLGAFGLSICYDMRFPRLYAAEAEAGAEALLAPAAFTVPTGKAHWHVLLRARAIETGCFVIAPAQCGTHADGRETYGHSLVVDPWGEVLLDMGEGVGIGHAAIHFETIGRVRSQVPALANARKIGKAVVS